ncbi:MAG: flagellar assembly protein FliW [Spirochaetales bacterium]|nr:MAG: flagellar assembly protein FliW [Spirochaetales bacterium]
MQIQTKPYGLIDADERQRLQFPFGIFGFENLKNYILMDAREQPFFWLQSLDVPEIAFILINPYLFRPDYSAEVDPLDLEEIRIEKQEDVLIFAIVTIPENQARMTANLQGPILINRKEKVGRQSISTNPRWKTKHLILEELAALGKSNAHTIA